MNFPFAMLSVSLTTLQDVGLMRVQRMQEPNQEAKEDDGLNLAEPLRPACCIDLASALPMPPRQQLDRAMKL